MDREKLLLLFIGGDSEEAPPLDPIRIQKGIFLLQQAAEMNPELSFKFEGHNYGPYSQDLRNEIHSLVRQDLVKPIPNGKWSLYAITEKGSAVFNAAKAERPDLAEYLFTLRGWVVSKNFSDLLRTIYKKYPDYASKTLLPHLR